MGRCNAGVWQAPSRAGGAGRVAVIALPEPSAGWRRMRWPQPRDTQRLSFVTSHGEMPRRGLGQALAGGRLPSETPTSHLGALCQLWVVADWLGLPHILESCPRLPMKGHEKPCVSPLFPMGRGNDHKSPLLFPPMGPMSP